MLCYPDSVDDVIYARFLSDPGVSLSTSKGYALHYAFYKVSTPEKISICFIRGGMESLGNVNVSIVHARK